MPTIGWFEILIVVAIAIIVLGPKDFPIMLKKAGSWIGTAKKYINLGIEVSLPENYAVHLGISDNEFKSKQWYHYLGEDNPYRRKWHKVFEQQGIIIVQNWTPDWGDHNHCCDMMFFDTGDHYDGKVKTDACIINGGMVKSTVKFNGTYYHSRDQGWRDNKVVWGSDVIYEFQKTNKPLGV